MMPTTIAALTFRQALARRRWIAILFLASLPILMAMLTRAYATMGDDPLQMVTEGLRDMMIMVVVPIVSLILANSVLGAEVDDGTVAYLLTKPIPRWHIALNKLIVIALIGGVVTASATLLTGIVALKTLDPTHQVLAYAAAAVLGSVLYAAVFLALSLLTRRGLLVGLVYVVVWEGALSSIFRGVGILSVRQYMLSLVDEITKVVPADPPAHPLPGAAHMMSAIVCVGAIIVCVQRLQKFEVGKSV